MNDEEKVTYFAETDARNKRIKFGIKSKDRSKHMYAIGKTGMGKSTLLENLAIQDIRDGNGLAFIDPHGKSADLLLEYIPKERINDVVYFAPFDMEYPVSFNVMEDVGPERRHLVSSGLMSAFKKIWVDAWSARMEYILNNIMLALLEYPGSTLLGVNRMLADKEFRKRVVDNITDPSVKAFWVDEYAKYTDKFAAEAAPAIQNKVGQFVTNPLIRNIIGQPKSTFDIRKIMDEKKILIINLSKGRVGESNANLLGSMLITKIYLAAMSRAEMNEKQLAEAAQFYLYVDEFQSFANESFADILSEARKYKLNLIIAHQYIEQMSEEVRAAVFGNVGTMCVFRVGAYDAEVLEKEFAPQFTAEDIVNLQKYQMYLKLMIDGVGSQPFSAAGLGPPERPYPSYTKDIINASRAAFARPRAEIESDIVNWLQDSLEGAQITAARAAERGGEYRYDGSYKGPAPEARGDRSGNRENRQERGVDRRSGDRPPERRPESARGEHRPMTASQSSNSPQRSDFRHENRSDNRPGSTEPLKSSSGGGAPKDGGQRLNPSQAQNRPFEGRSGPNSGVSSGTNNRENNARENEFRKAVSLSYLKNDNETKNDQKQAKPENIAALRDALLSVMKDAVPQTSNSSIIKSTEDISPTQVENKVKSERSHQGTDFQDTAGHQKVHPSQEGRGETDRSYSGQNKHLKEVPEDVLREIFKIEE